MIVRILFGLGLRRCSRYFWFKALIIWVHMSKIDFEIVESLKFLLLPFFFPLLSISDKLGPELNGSSDLLLSQSIKSDPCPNRFKRIQAAHTQTKCHEQYYTCTVEVSKIILLSSTVNIISKHYETSLLHNKVKLVKFLEVSDMSIQINLTYPEYKSTHNHICYHHSSKLKYYVLYHNNHSSKGQSLKQ